MPRCPACPRLGVFVFPVTKPSKKRKFDILFLLYETRRFQIRREFVFKRFKRFKRIRVIHNPQTRMVDALKNFLPTKGVSFFFDFLDKRSSGLPWHFLFLEGGFYVGYRPRIIGRPGSTPVGTFCRFR